MLAFILKKKDIILLTILAILIFQFIFGFHLIDFSNIYWLPDDAYNGFLGWSFYRNASETLPFFKIFDYGMGVGSTIIYTDSLPIFAIIFKPFSSLLPVDFQYFGLWLFLSFILTAYFSNRILTYLNMDFISKVFITSSLLLSPIMLERFIAGHFNLMSHWVLLWGILLYLENEKRVSKWFFILLISMLIHGYLFAMTLAITIFHFMRLYLEKHNKKYFISLFLLFVLSMFSLTAFGYFEVQADEVFHGGWGGYRLDILAFMNPIGRSLNWSTFIGEPVSFVPSQIGDLIEGFNYFGLGILLNILVSIYFLIKNSFNSEKPTNIPIYLKVLFLFSIFMIIFSLTNKVSLGGNELFSYNMPEFLKPLTKPFRASARFFWPVYYLILLGSIAINARNIKQKYLPIFFFFIFTIQIVDIQPGIQTIRAFNNKIYLNGLTKMDKEQTELTRVTKDYNQILYVFPEYANKNWRELLYFAYKNNKKTNFGYFARRNWNIQENYIQDLKKDFKNKILDKNSIYYFSDKKIYEELSSEVSQISTIITINDSNGLNHMLIIPNK